MNEADAFAKALVRTSPLCAADVEDLRAVFDLFQHSAGHKGRFVSAKQAVRVLRTFGLRNASLASNGGACVQDAGKPKLLINEQEFLLLAAGLMRAARADLLDGDLDLSEEKTAVERASRLFDGAMDPNGRGVATADSVKLGLLQFGCRGMDAVAASAFCDKVAYLDRVLYLDDGVGETPPSERCITRDEFVDFAAPLILPTVPARAVRYSFS